MASLFKPTIISYRLANGSTRATDGQRVTKDTPGAVRHERKAKKWYGRFTDAQGEKQRVPLSTKRDVAQQMLGNLIEKREQTKAGNVDPFEDHRNRPLTKHLDEWEKTLTADGITGRHVRHLVGCVRRMFKACKFNFIRDLAASRVIIQLDNLRRRKSETPVVQVPTGAEWFTKKELATLLGVTLPAVTALVRRHRLAARGNGKARRFPRATAEALLSLRSRGRGVRTSNFHLAAAKQFTRWLVKDRRAAADPFRHLAGGNVKLDPRHQRRALTEEELRRLLVTAAASMKVYRGLSGPDRRALYLAAMTTGFRAGELSVLVPERFALGADPPTIVLRPEDTKNGQGVVQPIPPEVAEALRFYLQGKPARVAVWPGSWVEKPVEVLRRDLDAAGIPYVVEGADGTPLYADFHALRHTFIALLDKAGATLKEAMQLARHSDPKLTMAVYGRAQLHDLGAAVDRLPSMIDGPSGEKENLLATGTDVADVAPFCPRFVPTADVERFEMITHERTGREIVRNTDDPNPLLLQGVEAVCASLITIDESAPCRTRTYNPLIKSQLLCQLS